MGTYHGNWSDDIVSYSKIMTEAADEGMRVSAMSLNDTFRHTSPSSLDSLSEALTRPRSVPL